MKALGAEMRVLLLILMVGLIPSGVFSKSVSMVCDSTYYRYTKKFFSDPIIEKRDKGKWTTFCERGNITDQGGSCVFIKKILNTYKIQISQDDVDKAQSILENRLYTCRKLQSKVNGAKGIKKAPHIGRLASTCRINNSDSFEGWNFVKFIPSNEQEKFWKMNDLDYYAMHLPQTGTYSGWYNEDEHFRFYLDFVTLQKWLYKLENNKEYQRDYTECELIK